jgi:cyclohexa-1,5-dienecarbonyl-CoA hydratase
MADQPDADPEVADDLYAPAARAAPRYVQIAIDQGVVRLTLNKPPANVLSIEVMEELAAGLESLQYEHGVKLVVVAAAGKYFSAGFDVAEHLGDRSYVMLETFRRILDDLARMDKPVLAVVPGPALGAANVLVAACDMAIAAASAKFGQPEIKAGVFNTGAAALLPRIVGRKRAFEIVLGGASISAAEAERIGLITRAVPDETLEAEAAVIAHRFQESSAAVLQCARRALAGGLDVPFADALRHAEDVYLNQLMASEDAVEGLQALLAKRKPAWKDR